MGDWAQTQDYNRVTITSGHLESVGAELRSVNASLNAGAVWPSANRAIYVPFVVAATLTVVKLLTVNGGALSGNVDCGIYDTGGNLLVSIGSTAQAGSGAVQSFDVTDTAVSPGVYYLALAMDNTSGNIIAATTGLSLPLVQAMGVLSQSSAFPLPATATFAAAQDTYVPSVGLTARTVV